MRAYEMPICSTAYQQNEFATILDNVKCALYQCICNAHAPYLSGENLIYFCLTNNGKTF